MTTLNLILGASYALEFGLFLYLYNFLRKCSAFEYLAVVEKRSALIGVYGVAAIICGTVAYQNFAHEFTGSTIGWRLGLNAIMTTLLVQLCLHCRKVRRSYET